MKQALKGALIGFGFYLILFFSFTLQGSLDFHGRCFGFEGSYSCSYFEYFRDAAALGFLFTFLASPILVIVGAVTGYIRGKFNKSAKWFYIINTIILLLTFLIIYFDPFELY